MNTDEPIGIIELGNINIKCLIFKVKDDNKAEILATSIKSSEGIYNNILMNLVKASNAIRSCISHAEKEAKVSLKKINVIFEQPDFLCTTFSKHKKINGSTIHKEDIEFLLKDAKKELILNDKTQSIIHIFNHNYVVDGKNFLEEPIGVYADTLTHEMTFITARKNNLKNINQTFIECDIDIERLFSRSFTLGVELLDNHELQSGSILIDLSFDAISMGLFKNLVMENSTIFPFGMNHITKDLSKILSLNLDEAENIRNNIDFNLENDQKIFDENNYLKSTYFIDSKFRKISKNLIFDIIKARLNEIIEILKKQLITSGFTSTHTTTLLVTGSGSNLINIEKYFSNFFELQIKKTNNFLELDKDLEKNFASCLGALKIIKDGWETEALPEIDSKNNKKIGFFSKIFGISK